MGIAWTCSTEFDADEINAISFVDDDAYVVLAKPPVQSGERYIDCTAEINCILIVCDSAGTWNSAPSNHWRPFYTMEELILLDSKWSTGSYVFWWVRARMRWS